MATDVHEKSHPAGGSRIDYARDLTPARSLREDSPAPSQGYLAHCRVGARPASGFGALSGKVAVSKRAKTPYPVEDGIEIEPALWVPGDATSGSSAALPLPSPKTRRQSDAVCPRRTRSTTSPRREYRKPAHATASHSAVARRCRDPGLNHKLSQEGSIAVNVIRAQRSCFLLRHDSLAACRSLSAGCRHHDSVSSRSLRSQ